MFGARGTFQTLSFAPQARIPAPSQRAAVPGPVALDYRATAPSLRAGAAGLFLLPSSLAQADPCVIRQLAGGQDVPLAARSFLTAWGHGAVKTHPHHDQFRSASV